MPHRTAPHPNCTAPHRKYLRIDVLLSSRHPNLAMVPKHKHATRAAIDHPHNAIHIPSFPRSVFGSTRTALNITHGAQSFQNPSLRLLRSAWINSLCEQESLSGIVRACRAPSSSVQHLDPLATPSTAQDIFAENL